MPDEKPPSPPPARAAAPTVARRLASHELFAGRQEVEIVHAGAVYRLRRTATGKLILTK